MNRIRKARMIAGVSQSELARLMGVAQVSVWKWETGKTFPNVKRLKRLAEVLDTSVEKLIDDEERAM